jgi:succinate-semialdehyde dehydrogenase / glutarate-semialdehyde dehydrogenase
MCKAGLARRRQNLGETETVNLVDPSLVHTQAFINGSFVDAPSGRTFGVDNPATGATIAEVAACDVSMTREAIEAAAAAFPAWAARPAKERGAILRRLFDLMVANADDLAKIITAEHGKPLAEAKGEVMYAASFLEWFAEEARRVEGSIIASPLSDRRLVVLRQPVGVTAGITPWNFPSAMVTRKLGPALAVGCTFILKPAEQTPLSALAIAELAVRAGVPAGVFSVVTGSANDAPIIGGELTSNPTVRKLSFTGSTAVGKLLTRQCADTMKKVSMELGGNAPFVVFADADVDAAVAGALVAKYRNAGQACTAANRFYVQEGIKDEFAAKYATEVAKYKVGVGTDEGVTIGPLIDEAAIEKVRTHVKDALDRGARILVGGADHSLGGRFFQPTLLDNVATGSLMCQEETFGPVAGITSFQTEAEAIALANDTPFGLTAYVFTRDHARVWRVSEALESGMVAVNTGLLSTAEAPFGGVKESGLGREGSRWGIDDWSELKYIAMAGL